MYVFDNKKKAFGQYDPASLAAAAMKKAAEEAAEAARKKAEEASDASEWFYSTNVPETTGKTAATAPGATAPGAKAEAGNTMLYLAIGAVVLFFLMKK